MSKNKNADKAEVCHTVDDRTHEAVSVYCFGTGAVVVAGDRLIHLAQK
jgi:hypothetical protein